MTDPAPEPDPNLFQLTFTASGVVGQGTAPDEENKP